MRRTIATLAAALLVGATAAGHAAATSHGGINVIAGRAELAPSGEAFQFQAGYDGLALGSELVILVDDPGDGVATVVDEIDFEITHVIRAEEHLSNTHPQLLIAQGLGAELPVFAHVPYVAAPGGKKKLSKRNPPPGEIRHLCVA